jgi:hypothetical protein
MPAVAGERVAGRRTTVAVSKLRVGNPVGKGISVSVAVGEIVSVAESAGIAEPFGVGVLVVGPGVQVIKVIPSAPW